MTDEVKKEEKPVFKIAKDLNDLYVNNVASLKIVLKAIAEKIDKTNELLADVLKELKR